MKKFIKYIFLVLSVVFITSCTGEKQDKEKMKRAVEQVKAHHIMDDYSFTITDGVGFPLPIILFDGGVQVFMSSSFDHGKEVVESNGNYYKLYHGKIYKTDAAGTISYDEHHHPKNDKPLDFSITKNVVVIILMSILIFFVFDCFIISFTLVRFVVSQAINIFGFFIR